MLTKDYFYELPQSLIAQTPIENRSQSRLLVYDRRDHSCHDAIFDDILQYLKPNDILVRNTTRVIPARLLARREGTGGHMEFLLLRKMEGDSWEALVRPGRRAKEGLIFRVNDALQVQIERHLENGNRLVRLLYHGIFEEILESAGQIPLPPYITQRLEDAERYQTVYARERGSAAAPTAGLHFTEALLEKIAQQGIGIVDILLHVGLGTFRPVSTATIEEHHMHAEYFQVSEHAANAINRARRMGGRVIAVGTTTCRTLESAADEAGIVHAKNGWTDIFITPGYRFRAVDALITNFHLPESTLLMLVSAFASREGILQAYRHAVQQKYRFFSFGDAMLIV